MRRARRTAIAVTAAVAALALHPSPAAADDTITGQIVEIVGVDGPIEFGGRAYSGRFQVRAVSGRIVLVEIVDPDTYMRGIREVPASWNTEALKAQAVAARTYLAWTLNRGRSGAGAEFGFDICATSACQVYRGGAGEAGAARWDAAVAATAGEILLFDGTPAQALYSSTSGGRTRNVEDVFGSTPKPYLQAVESPGEQSPYVRWVVVLTERQLGAIFAEAGITAELLSLSVAKTADGEGPWVVHGLFTDRMRTWTTWQFRGLINVNGPRALPDVLPGLRADGRRLPQVVLGPSYTIVRGIRYDPSITEGTPLSNVYYLHGGGWGHDVGMSQYGAQAMAEAGASYREILAHYYSGLAPEPADRFLPASVVVGLAHGTGSVTVGGTLAVAIDGAPVADALTGDWVFGSTGVKVKATPPAAFGVDPALAGLATRVPSDGQLVVAAVPGGGQVRLIVFDAGTPVYRSEWMNWFGGRVVYAPLGLRGGPTISVVVQHRDPSSGAERVVPVTTGLLLWR